MSTVLIPHAVLDHVGRRLESAGATGAEATGLLVAGPDGLVRRAVFPDQRAGRLPDCWVEVTEQGKRELATGLKDDERYVSRVHSHPGQAFHSPTDDRNPALRIEGAISIVVPFFGLGLRLGLDNCAVLVRRDQHWCDLPAGDARDEVIYVER